MPAMVGELAGVQLVGWSLAIYELGAIVAGAAAGRLVSYVPLRTNMVVAALLYAAGALICATAPSMPLFLAGRLIEGFGGGALVSLAFVSVERLFPRAIWPQLFGVMSAIWGVAAFSGPLLGAIMTELLSWRWAFGIFTARRHRHGAGELHRARHAGGDAGRGNVGKAPPFPFAALGCLAVSVVLIATAGVDIALLRSSLLLALGLAGLALFFSHRRAEAALAAVPVTAVLLALAGRRRHDHGRRLFGGDLLLRRLRTAAPDQPARHSDPDHRLHHRRRIDRLVDPVDPRRQRAAASASG